MIRNREALLAGDAAGKRALALDLLEVALRAVDAEAATARALRSLRDAGEVADGGVLLAFGKAAGTMARGAASIMEVSRGLVVGPSDPVISGCTWMPGGHPLPNEASLGAGAAALALGHTLERHDTVVALVSGGGSAMLEALPDGLALNDLRAVTEAMMLAGASIEELNRVRRALSRIKGGGLLRALRPAKVVNVVISDVPGLPPEMVASGPTFVAPGGDGSDILAILEKRGVTELVPPALREALAAPTPPDEGPPPVSVVAADGVSARNAMVEAAKARGHSVVAYPRLLAGEARDAGAMFVRGASRQPVDLVVATGETTVTVKGKGKGGRNQEFVLGAAMVVGEGVLASIGTDGVDGSSDVAGALVDAELLRRAERRKLDPGEHLLDNNTAAYFRAAGGSILTGPTGTNVADVAVYVR